MCPLARQACLSQISLNTEVGVVVYLIVLWCLISIQLLLKQVVLPFFSPLLSTPVPERGGGTFQHLIL